MTDIYCSKHGLALPCPCCSPVGRPSTRRMAFFQQGASDMRCLYASIEALMNPALPDDERRSIGAQAQWLAEGIEDQFNQFSRKERNQP